MKKLIILISLLGLLFSCNTASVSYDSETSHRIIGKESNVYDGYGYQIIEVDGVEYICASGGICPLVEDTLKK